MTPPTGSSKDKPQTASSQDCAPDLVAPVMGMTAGALRWAGSGRLVPTVVPDRAVFDGELFRWFAFGGECVHMPVMR